MGTLPNDFGMLLVFLSIQTDRRYGGRETDATSHCLGSFGGETKDGNQSTTYKVRVRERNEVACNSPFHNLE